MNKRTILNIVLIAVVVGLGLLVYFQPNGKQAKPKVKLTDFKPANVNTIRIEQPKKPRVKLVRGGGAWQMEAPVTAPADSGRIASVLGNLDETSAGQFSAAGTELAKYGLKSPKLTLWINGKKLAFGATEPINRHRYIRIGHTIHVADDSLYYRLAGDPMQFVSKQLLPKHADITAIQLPNQTVTLGKNGEWQLAPKNPKISADTVQKFVDAWKNARAIDVSTWKPQKSKGEVAVELQNRKAPLRLAIVKKQSSFVLARPDLKLKYEMPDSRKETMLTLKPRPEPKAPHGNKQKALGKSKSSG